MILKSLLGCRLQKILITVFYFDVFADLVMNSLKRKDHSIKIFDSMFHVDVFVDLMMIVSHWCVCRFGDDCFILMCL